MKIPEDVLYKLPTDYKSIREKELRELFKQLILSITDMYREIAKAVNYNENFIRGQEKSSDPTDPDEGRWVMWMSDGTGSGDAGDIMISINSGGTVKTGTVVDYSGL